MSDIDGKTVARLKAAGFRYCPFEPVIMRLVEEGVSVEIERDHPAAGSTARIVVPYEAIAAAAENPLLHAYLAMCRRVETPAPPSPSGGES